MIQQTDFSLITKVLGNYWDFMKEIDSNSFIANLIPDSMLDKTKSSKFGPEYAHWIPIKSTITSEEIQQLENILSFSLPDSFKFFLRQNHFIELYLGSHNIGFFQSVPHQLISEYSKKIKNYNSNLINRSLVPFAEVSDWGILCFDIRQKDENNEYAIVILDHEDGYESKQFYAKNFLSLFEKFDKNLLEWRQNWRSKHNLHNS